MAALGVLAPDGISSSAYGTEEILIELLKGGLAITAFTLILPLTGVVLFVMALVVLSYREVVSVSVIVAWSMGSLSASVHRGWFPILWCPISLSGGDDHDRAAGVVGDLGADRSHQQALESAGPAGTDYQHLGVGGRLKERLGGQADDGPDGDR